MMVCRCFFKEILIFCTLSHLWELHCHGVKLLWVPPFCWFLYRIHLWNNRRIYAEIHNYIWYSCTHCDSTVLEMDFNKIITIYDPAICSWCYNLLHCYIFCDYILIFLLSKGFHSFSLNR